MTGNVGSSISSRNNRNNIYQCRAADQRLMCPTCTGESLQQCESKQYLQACGSKTVRRTRRLSLTFSLFSVSFTHFLFLILISFSLSFFELSALVAVHGNHFQIIFLFVTVRYINLLLRLLRLR